MQGPQRQITASMLYNHLACPHRVAMDAFADWRLRDTVSPFVEMLWARGNKYEADVVAAVGEPYLDLSALKGDEKEAATRAAIARGETFIYNGRLSGDGLLGEPDLLRREGDGYVAIDIKSGAGEESAGDEDEGLARRVVHEHLADEIAPTFNQAPSKIPCQKCGHVG